MFIKRLIDILVVWKWLLSHVCKQEKKLMANDKKSRLLDEDKKAFGGWFVWLLALFVLAIVVFGIVGAGGKIFSTAVEREVFEQSYQRSAAEEARYNTMKAELTGVETRLRSGGNLTEVQRSDLEAQAAALRVQINTMEK